MQKMIASFALQKSDGTPLTDIELEILEGAIKGVGVAFQIDVQAQLEPKIFLVPEGYEEIDDTGIFRSTNPM